MIHPLQTLADNRQTLLLAEVVALLHDIGKLSSQFIDQMSTSPTPRQKRFEHEKAIEAEPSFVNPQFLAILKDTRLRDLLRWPLIQGSEQIGTVLDLILRHDKRGHNAFLVRLVNRCDGLDSGADKGTTKEEGLPRQAQQSSDKTFISTAFGVEPQQMDLSALDNVRISLSAVVAKALADDLPSVRTRTLLEIQSAYSGALGETRRSANDVTLWDHSFSVATLYKTALAALLWHNQTLNLDQLGWRLLRVNFDVLGLYAKTVKIADLLGYQRAVGEACAAVKQLVEEEYPLGNEVYRDTTGIYFTFPDVALPAELAQEIRRRVEGIELELAPRIQVGQAQGNTAVEQLKRLLAEQRQEARQELAQPITSSNLSSSWQTLWTNLPDGSWEVCPVCRLRPKRTNAEVCETCRKRRQSRVDSWLEDPSKTIWLDELADSNGRVALIVAKFGLDDWLSGDLVQTMLVKAAENDPNQCRPKNPSPARLRRIWETTQRFWTEAVGQLLDKLPCRMRWELSVSPLPSLEELLEQTVYDGSLDNGQPVSVWRRGDRLLTISYLPGKPSGTLKVSWEMNHRARSDALQIREACPAEERFLYYRPSLTLLTSPDQFLALIPASEALGIANCIHQQYQREFGKVQNRLPLFLGLVFFQRKMPLMAVMDTARRMLEMVHLDEEEWIVAKREPDCLTFTNGISWRVPTKMGDGATEDTWYPYFFVEGDPGQRKYRFQHGGRWLVHVQDLRPDDKVQVTPSRFAYLYLEHSAQRFRFEPAKDVLLLDELPRLIEMWKSICRSPGMSDTKLQSIWALLESKWRLWGLDDTQSPESAARRATFEQLVKTTFAREGIRGVKPDDVLSSSFQRCLELYLHILKQRVKEESHEREPETV